MERGDLTKVTLCLKLLRYVLSLSSLGEQQRLAFARVLVSPPSLCVLDESSSALDLASEAMMYGLLSKCKAEGGGLMWVSVGHR